METRIVYESPEHKAQVGGKGVCEHCGASYTANRNGRPSVYCSTRCRVAAHRAAKKQAGAPSRGRMDYQEAKAAGHGNMTRRNPKTHIHPNHDDVWGRRLTYCGQSTNGVLSIPDSEYMDAAGNLRFTCKSCRGAFPKTKFGPTAKEIERVPNLPKSKAKLEAAFKAGEYCGVTAVVALTGKSHKQVQHAYQAHRFAGIAKKRRVTYTFTYETQSVLKGFGLRLFEAFHVTPEPPHTTLNQLAKRLSDGVYLVFVPGHVLTMRIKGNSRTIVDSLVNKATPIKQYRNKRAKPRVAYRVTE